MNNRSSLLALLCTGILACLALSVAGQKKDNPSLEALLERSSTSRFLVFRDDANLKVSDLFTGKKALFNLGPDDQVVNFHTGRTASGLTIHRYQQYYRHLPVEFAYLIVHERDGKVKNLIGEYFNGIGLPTNPGLSEGVALDMALDRVNASVYLWDLPKEEADRWISPLPARDTYFPEGTLCIINESIDRKGLFHLAWKFEINAVVPMKRTVIYVDAIQGSILHEFGLIRSDETPQTNLAHTIYSGIRQINTTFYQGEEEEESYFHLKDQTRGGGIITKSLGGAQFTQSSVQIKNTGSIWYPTGNPINSGLDVHWGMQMTFDYYKNFFNRSSYDNANGVIEGYVHFLTQHDNAYWTGNNFIFGDGNGITSGPIVGLDIVAHEFTHAVTGYSIPGGGIHQGLIYQAESGALNEGLSDIFGTMVEMKSKQGNWTMGEGVIYSGARSLASPKAYGQPDTYGGINWINPTAPYMEGNDFGGVHTNCSVFSHWFYLLSVGGSGVNDNDDEFVVEPIGIDAAAAIVYQAITTAVTPSDDYAAMRAATITTAIAMNGGDECAEPVKQVKNAWFAVGVGDPAVAIKDVFITQPGCNEENGSITVKLQYRGDTPGYQWSNGETTMTIEDLASGEYSLTITDANEPHCTIEKDFTLEESSPVSVSLSTSDESSCHANDGTAIAIANLPGGVTPEYLWSNGETTFAVSDLPPGEYGVTVTDPNTGCEGSRPFIIREWKPTVTIHGDGNRTQCAFDDPVKVTGVECEEDNCFWKHVYDPESYYGTVLPPGPTANIFDDGYYIVFLLHPLGCVGSDTGKVMLTYRDCGTDKDDDKRWRIPTFEPIDPNEISGPGGFSTPQFVAAKENMPYTVFFENDPELATAPATRIHVEVPVDADVNLYSFRLGSFGFRNLHFDPPANATFYTTRLDVRDSLGVFVDLTAGIDVNSRKVFWTFQAIDPATGMPPVDPMMGLLPVNDTATHVGEGFVSFTWKPASGAATGDSIQAQAAIVFDLNETIITNAWNNTVDALPPLTVAAAFQSVTDSTTILLAVSGSDDSGGSGIHHFSVYVSENEGPFMKFNDFLPGTPVLFSGSPGSTYRFFSVGTDNVGQAENMKTAAETQVHFLTDDPFVSGTLTYRNAASTPLSQVHLYLKDSYGQSRDDVITGNQGEYLLFIPAAGSYTIEASTDKPAGSINAADALLVLRHFVELDTLQGLAWRSADVNGSGNINAADALSIAHHFVDPAFQFPAGPWLFEQDTLIYALDNLQYDFKGCCTGDIDGSYIPPVTKPQPELALFENRHRDIRIGEITDIPLSVEKNAEVGAVSLVIYYEEEKLEVLDVIPGGNGKGNLDFRAQNGVLRIAWYDVSPMILKRNDVLLSIRLRAKEQPATVATLFSLGAECSLADGKGVRLENTNLFIPAVRIDVPFLFVLLQNQPNPFSSQTRVRFSLPEKAAVTLRVTDMTGREVMVLLSEEKERGTYELNLDGKQLNNGNYILEMQATGETKHHRDFVRMVRIGK